MLDFKNITNILIKYTLIFLYVKWIGQIKPKDLHIYAPSKPRVELNSQLHDMCCFYWCHHLIYHKWWRGFHGNVGPSELGNVSGWTRKIEKVCQIVKSLSPPPRKCGNMFKMCWVLFVNHPSCVLELHSCHYVSHRTLIYFFFCSTSSYSPISY